MTLYVQHEFAGRGTRSQLAARARAAPSLLVMRLYWPKPEALDGKWKAPPLVLASAGDAAGQNAAVPVTPDNFLRAESDLYFGNIVKDGGFGQVPPPP